MEWLLSKTDDDTLDDPLSEEEEEEEEAGALVSNSFIYAVKFDVQFLLIISNCKY